MINAARVATEFASLLPMTETPEATVEFEAFTTCSEWKETWNAQHYHTLFATTTGKNLKPQTNHDKSG